MTERDRATVLDPPYQTGKSRPALPHNSIALFAY